MGKVSWKHHQAERDVENLLRPAAKLDPEVLEEFPRPVEDIIAAALPAVSFEYHKELSVGRVVEVLGDVYRADARSLLKYGDGPLAGFTYGSRDAAVVFATTTYGEPFVRFTLAHEAGHILKEYLPWLEQQDQQTLFGGPGGFYARRDPPGHLLAGSNMDGKAEGWQEQVARLKARRAFKREVIANICAAELLAPWRQVRTLVAKLDPAQDPVRALQDHFGLSRKAATIRLQELNLIDQDPHPTLSLFA